MKLSGKMSYIYYLCDNSLVLHVIEHTAHVTAEFSWYC